jgi:hypothetical protein
MSIPLEITNLKKLYYFNYLNNPIKNILNPIINIFINKIKDNSIKSLFDNKEKTNDLIKQINDDNKIDYFDDLTLMDQTVETLIKYVKDNKIHSLLNCTFEEIVQSILLEIIN